MNAIFKRYLFERHILVSEGVAEENCFEVLFSLAHFFGINVKKGHELVSRDMLITAGECLGHDVPEPFYRGFPTTVRSLTKEQLLFDQLLHYFINYGMGDFSETGHSVFEAEDFTRLAFNERVRVKDFVCLGSEEAEEYLRGCIDDLFASSRPLSKEQAELVTAYVTEYNYIPERIASKSTAVRILRTLRDTRFAKFLYLSDVIKLVDEINFYEYGNRNIKRLSLKNADRRFLSELLDRIFEGGYVNIRDCFEKKAVWCGFLHHIHYQPRCEAAEKFCHLMRNKGNQSVYAEVEKYLSERDVCRAVDALKAGKGDGGVLRALDYLVSRCENKQDLQYVLSSISSGRPVLLLQLIMHYARASARGARTFQFVKHNMLRNHTETPAEVKARRTRLGARTRKAMLAYMSSMLSARLKGSLGRVYVHPDMYKIAIPMHEAAANGGFGTLPSGSRVKLDEGQKIRAFTYWEKVYDIDLSMFGITKSGEEEEFSWRTMYYNQSDMITFSGDEVSGYDGGSEYFDVELDLLAEKRPDLDYLIFCNNVYSGTHFGDCVCTAGYMMRDKVDSGEVFEPKTVKSSFKVTADSTYAYLFAIDLHTRELIWLNLSLDSGRIVAADERVSLALERIGELDVMSAGELLELCATEVVDDPALADVAFTDEELPELEGREQIHSYEYSRIMKLLG